MFRTDTQGSKHIAPATSQGRKFLKISGIVVILAGMCHLLIGAEVAPVIFCVSAIMLSLLPLAYFGPLNIAAVLIALVGFRYVGFPIFAKLAVGQALDTNLLNPAGAFGVVLVGVMGYLAALGMVSRVSERWTLLGNTSNPTVLARISFLAAWIGIAANMAEALKVTEMEKGTTIAAFFVPFLHLAFIAAIARAVVSSNRQRSVDPWVVSLLIAEVSFAIIRNSRMALMEILLCFLVTISAFRYQIRWRQFLVVVVAIGMMTIFITPVFLYVRSFRGDLSWNARISATVGAIENWPETFSYYMQRNDLYDRSGWFLNYYGSRENTLERISHINHVDVLKAGFDRRGKVGWEDISTALQRVPPRFLAPDKIRGYSQGTWLYENMGISTGPYATAALIGNGYAAFGWPGAFLYPAVLGALWLLIIRKISGFEMQGNIWAVYLLLRVHNQFVEGGVDSYFVHIFRSLPQDFLLMWAVKIMAEGRLFLPWRKKREVGVWR